MRIANIDLDRNELENNEITLYQRMGKDDTDCITIEISSGRSIYITSDCQDLKVIQDGSNQVEIRLVKARS